MACKFVILLACACALVGAAHVSRREAPAAGSNPLQDIQKHAEDLQKNFVESINKFISSKPAADYKKTLTEGVTAVEQQLTSLSASWSAASKDASGKVKEALETSRANIDKTVADLRKAHPELEQQATALGDSISKALTSALKESQNLAQQVQEHVAQTNKELTPKLQAAYDDLAKQVQDVQKKLHEAAADKQ